MAKFDIPETVTGIRLCKMRGEDLVTCEPVHFARGAVGVDTVLRRAEVCGRVGPIGETGDFWADLMTPDGDLIDTVALDAKSYRSIKTHWARCRIER